MDIKKPVSCLYVYLGSINYTKMYENGWLHGTAKYYNEKGILTFEGEYKNGQKDGVCIKYYEDGKKQLSQKYENDRIVDNQNLAQN